MSCRPPSNWPLPRADEPFRLVCLRRETDMYPSPAWVVPTVVGTAVTGYSIYSDAEMTAPFVGYDISDIVPCTNVEPGSSENNPIFVVGGSSAAPTAEAEFQIFCDLDANGFSTATFLRRYNTIASGAPAIVDTLLDGVTPYVVVGTVGLCSENPSDPNYSYSSMAYDGDGNLTRIRRTPTAPGFPVVTQEQVYTYVGNQLTAISAWNDV
jgi:hypothetical protein